jgi:hypothetical protein
MLSANRPALLARLRLAEQEALGDLEGEPVIHHQLALAYGTSPRAWRQWPHAFVAVFNRPLPAASLPSAAALHRWLKRKSTPDAGAAVTPLAFDIFEDRLKLWDKRRAAAPPQAPLLAAADLAARFARLAPLTRGNVVIATMLGDRCVAAVKRFSGGGIAALGISQRQIPWVRLLSGTSDDDADDLSPIGATAELHLGWLEGLAAGGDAVLDLARRVDHWQRLVDETCSSKRQTSRLRRVSQLGYEYPALTASSLAGLLGISRQGATSLLEDARSLRILREVTQGNGFRRYVAAI